MSRWGKPTAKRYKMYFTASARWAGAAENMDILLASPRLDVYGQMALDESLVRARPNEITLRFYRWTDGPAVTFGYAQFVSEVRRALQEKHFQGPYARRPTGGGIVYHGEDLTFSLIFPGAGRPAEIYEKFHARVHEQLMRLGSHGGVFHKDLPPSAYAPSLNHTASACFSNPVENDLLSETGAKILGGALRRFGTTVLYQGSLQVPKARENPAYKQAVIEAVRTYLAADLNPRGADEALLAEAEKLAKNQYEQPSWTEKF